MDRFETTSPEVLVGDVLANQPYRKPEAGDLERRSW
jgi:hypothetical protein